MMIYVNNIFNYIFECQLIEMEKLIYTRFALQFGLFVNYPNWSAKRVLFRK